MGKRRACAPRPRFGPPRADPPGNAGDGKPKQHSMDVDATKPAASDGWDYGGGAASGAADEMVTDGGAGAGACAPPSAPPRARSQAARAVAPPRTAPSVSVGDGGAKMGLFGLVSGGCAPPGG